MPSSSDLLEKLVRDELATFAVTRDGGAIGEQLPDAWFDRILQAMETAIVTPYPAKVRDLDPASGDLVVIDTLVVADDRDGSLVLFDLSADEFMLAVRDPDMDRSRSVDLVACGVRGGAVDCFLSR